ncbi:ubiquitin carboxyl-terminal hydrolase-domain-containing protein [Entophlyctis helioformis]|nr:ubiquitin carboxyl-terminal hydrolase-domain-containing protein [Entophlyctis helioformis]
MFAVAWDEQRRLQLPAPVRAPDTAVSAVCFDAAEELLWCGTAWGHVSSYVNAPPSLVRYTAFPAHRARVLQVLVADRGVLSLSPQTVRLSIRRGVQIWAKMIPHASCMAFATSPSDLFVGTSAAASSKLLQLNLHRGTVAKEIDSDQGIVAMKQGRLLAQALTSGQVVLRDPKTLQAQHTINAHGGGVAAMDVSGNVMITCGYSPRDDAVVADPLVKLYDLRMMRQLAPIPFSAGPCQVRFNPRMPAHAFIFGQTGQIQICDTSSPNYTGVTFFRAELQGLLTAVDVSSAGDAVCLADSSGGCVVWSTKPDFSINKFSRVSEYRDFFPPEEAVPIEDDTPLSVVGMPHYKTQLLSAWPSWILSAPGRPSPRIPPEVLKNVKMNDFVGYAPNPRTFKRNQNILMASSRDGREEPKFRSQQQRDRHRRTRGDSESPEPAPATAATAAGSSPSLAESAAAASSTNTLDTRIPPYYRAVEIKYSKFGVEDFDFGFYNHTAYGGLETHIQNSYCNSLLQTLFFVRPLRELVKAHVRSGVCRREPCLTCELGFLCRMLEDCGGVNCHASNFLRAFASVNQASTLGLNAPELTSPPGSVPYGSLTQTLCRFLLECIHQELKETAGASLAASMSPEPAEASIDGTKTPVPSLPMPSTGSSSVSGSNISRCNQGHEQIRDTKPFVIELNYDRKVAPPVQSVWATQTPQPHPPQPFHKVLQNSIARESSTPAWCDVCGKYRPTSHSRRLRGPLPERLVLNAKVGEADIGIWARPNSSNSNNSSSSSSSAEPFLPSSFGMIERRGLWTAVDLKSLPKGVDANSPTLAIYDLQSTICEIRIDKEPWHLVACINVADQGETPKWHVFNDFLVQEIPAGEERMFADWKIPATVVYARRRSGQDVSPVVRAVASTPASYSLLFDNPTLNQRDDLVPTHVPLAENEMPTRGFMCAIDAEFVSISNAETEIRSDGTKSVIRPSQMALARVSVLRASGPLAGVPFIDDYVLMTQPVVNYLTEFSGITPEDLDPALSRHPLVTLKTAYAKLRMLLDLGCTFIGHGLKMDCRTINMIIPPSQIIDTVDIFHIKKLGRKLSLRYLVWFFFAEDIQLHTHDSIEDARSALRIYEKYLESVSKGTFDALLDSVYEKGRIYGTDTMF